MKKILLIFAFLIVSTPFQSRAAESGHGHTLSNGTHLHATPYANGYILSNGTHVHGQESNTNLTSVLSNIIADLKSFFPGFILVIILGAAYFLPSIIAGKRQHLNTTPILLSNIFFGWTLIGWLVCLIWSTSSNVASQFD